MATMAPTLSGLPLAVLILRFVSPLAVALATLSLFFTHPPPPASPSPISSVVVASRIPRRAVILVLLSLSGFSYFLDGITLIVFAVIQKQWTPYTDVEFNAIVGLAAFAGLAALGTWKDIHGVEVWFLKRVKASVAAALVLDLALTVTLLQLSVRRDTPEILHLAFPASRVILLLPLLASLLTPHIVYSPVQPDEDYEGPVATASSFAHAADANTDPSTGLLTVPGLSSAEASKYGTFRPSRSILQQSNPTTRAPTPTPSQRKADEKPEIVLDPSWSELWRRIKRLSPYLWPSKSPSLQVLAGICIVILLIGRVVNAIVPFALAELVRIFEHRSDRSPWLVLAGYVALRFLQGSGGLAALRDCLWAPVMQYSDLEMSELSFNHLLNLSFAFHTRRKTGEILRVLDRGAAINHTLELILFNILPTFVDIAIALVVFCVTFEWRLSLVIFIVMFAYVAASVILTRWRTKIRRQMNERDIVTRGIHTDCLLNYETVKYFSGEEHEAARYRDAIREYQALEYRVIISLNLLNLVQNFIITLGLLVGSFIVARGVIRDGSGPSEFVFFITYLAQLYGPLNQLGYIYRSVNQSLVDTEKLLKLLNEPTDINDKPNAPDLIVQDGEIEFENVNFSYDGRTTALNGVSFKVPKGGAVALVGESGSGKSTILRLLYRFYDLGAGEGRILIDGKDIRDVTQKSLRQAIGVVPQDSVLFNTTIGYNIGYGKFGSSAQDIEAAARSAQMHDRIMSFPQGYETTVGERGVRLSGGEKQRVAIARTLLKNPPILLLDEATSALDTSTEKDIQKALQNLMIGRSSLSIAHRLSTIAQADVILVLKDGQIVEQGNHKELLALDGIFASMWSDQVSATEDPSPSIEEPKQELSGYSVGPSEPSEEPVVVEDRAEIEPSDLPSEPTVEVPSEPALPVDPILSSEREDDISKEAVISDTTPITFPTSDPVEEEVEPTAASPVVASPTSETAAPLAFPTSEDEEPSPAPAPEPLQSPPPTPGVTFDPSTSPARTGTPDPDAEPKRKRISSQNFQRLARRISITTKRSGSMSSMIPGLKRDKSDGSPRVSVDDGAAGSTRGEGSVVHDSPVPSITGDADSKSKKKKDKKDKKKKGSTG